MHLSGGEMAEPVDITRLLWRLGAEMEKIVPKLTSGDKDAQAFFAGKAEAYREIIELIEKRKF